MGIFDGLLNLLFPPKCAFCGKFLKTNEKGICPKCRKAIAEESETPHKTTGEFFDVCYSPLLYRDTVRSSIIRFKFKGATGNVSSYADILADCIRKKLDGEYDIITWVPISRERETNRGYDQSMLLAMATALALDDVAVETLKKCVDVPAQSSLVGAEKRRANVCDAFIVPDRDVVAQKRILLIDDVVTTGATLSECARTLLLSGAESVVCAALAKA